MVWRGVVVRTLEWRARWFSDPAERLHFLRRNVGERAVRPVIRWRGDAHPFRRALVMVITFLAALANTDSVPTLPLGKPTPVRAAASVWLVQTTPQFDLYSNGLRIEEQYATFTEHRRYLAFARAHADAIASGAEWRSVPAGIVYHTTESHWTSFEESK